MSSLAIALSQRARRQYKNKETLRYILTQEPESSVKTVKKTKSSIIMKIKFYMNRFL